MNYYVEWINFQKYIGGKKSNKKQAIKFLDVLIIYFCLRLFIFIVLIYITSK